MKTLLAVLTAGMLTATTPNVVKENLLGFTVFPNYVISVEWDLDKDGNEDLRAFYTFSKCIDSQGLCTTPRPWMYFHDLNNDQIYQDHERFQYTTDHNGKKTSK